MLRFLGLPSVNFDQVRMMSQKKSVNRLFLPSLSGVKIVDWEFDPGSCLEMGREASLCFVFMFALQRLSVGESVAAGVCSGRL